MGWKGNDAFLKIAIAGKLDLAIFCLSVQPKNSSASKGAKTREEVVVEKADEVPNASAHTPFIRCVLFSQEGDY